MATLEDGLYAQEKSIADPKMADKLARFLKASLKGWDYAIANQDEAVKIVLDNDASGAQTKQHQKRMMGEIAKLVGSNAEGPAISTPRPTTAPSKTLLTGKSDPVISKQAGGRLDARHVGEGDGAVGGA